MGDVISITDRMAHLAGDAECLACGHKWMAEIPVGMYELKCPSCHTHRGVMSHSIMPEEHFSCSCGCAHYGIGIDFCAICVKCGKKLGQGG